LPTGSRDLLPTGRLDHLTKDLWDLVKVINHLHGKRVVGHLRNVGAETQACIVMLLIKRSIMAVSKVSWQELQT